MFIIIEEEGGDECDLLTKSYSLDDYIVNPCPLKIVIDILVCLLYNPSHSVWLYVTKVCLPLFWCENKAILSS